jgi:hypothetical protein
MSAAGEVPAAAAFVIDVCRRSWKGRTRSSISARRRASRKVAASRTTSNGVPFVGEAEDAFVVASKRCPPSVPEEFGGYPRADRDRTLSSVRLRCVDARPRSDAPTDVAVAQEVRAKGPLCAPSEMELARLEPAASWVRSRRSPALSLTCYRDFGACRLASTAPNFG